MVWTNGPARVYHGTTLTNAKKIIAGGVNPSVGSAAADFGQGFYVTTVLRQAEQWANQKLRTRPISPTDMAAVLIFDIDRDALSKLGDHLTFVIADADFHDFALYNRLGGASHYRIDGKSYDVVYGPLAAFPQTLSYANCDQICFVAGGKHVASALQSLGNPAPVPMTGNPFFP